MKYYNINIEYNHSIIITDTYVHISRMRTFEVKLINIKNLRTHLT